MDCDIKNGFGLAARKTFLELEQEIMAEQRKYKRWHYYIMFFGVIALILLAILWFYIHENLIQNIICSFFVGSILISLIEARRKYLRVLESFEDIIFNTQRILNGDYNKEN